MTPIIFLYLFLSLCVVATIIGIAARAHNQHITFVKGLAGILKPRDSSDD